MKTETQLYIEKLRDEYLEGHFREQERDELIAENNIDKRDIKGYHGREILELLQNADDAYQKSVKYGIKTKDNLEVHLHFDGDYLTIENTGSCFDREGIKAIVQGNNSSKGKGKYIGNKGTGFRSILNWSDEIKIYSGEFNIEFSKIKTDRIFHENIKKPQIEKQLKKNTNLQLSILGMPYNIEPIDSIYDTVIQVKVNPEKNSDGFGVEDQIKDIDPRILLFLPNIDKISIDLFENCIVYERFVETDEFNQVELKKCIDGEKCESEFYYLFSKVIKGCVVEDNKEKDVWLSIAVPKDVSVFKASHIYTFFPLQESVSPFNCVLHATYELGSNRNTLTLSETNRQIIKYQLDFLIEVANKFTKKKYDNTALNLLLPIGIVSSSWEFSNPFKKLLSKSDYFDSLRDAKILQTINDEYISINDMPKVLKGPLPSVFAGKSFSRLLKPLSEKQTRFIKEIAIDSKISVEYSASELISIINSQSHIWTISQQIEVFIWWNESNYDGLPKLLKKQNGDWFTYKEDCYFLTGDVIGDIPYWVNIPSINSDYQNELFSQAKTIPKIVRLKEEARESHISRLISQNQVFGAVKFKYRDKNNIIPLINGSVDTFDKGLEFVEWLWCNYKRALDWMPPTGIEYKFPDIKGNSIKDSKALYFGIEYGYSLSEKLFDSNFGLFPPFTSFKIADHESKDFTNFITRFGVKKFPSIEKQEIVPVDKYKKQSEKLVRDKEKLESETFLAIVYEIPYIENLTSILERLTTAEIISWLQDDCNLKNNLRSEFYTGEAKLKYKGARQQYHRIYDGEIENYILFTFNHTKWIEIDGTKYAPVQVLNEFNLRSNKDSFNKLLPILSPSYIEAILKKTRMKREEVEGIFKLFSLCNRPTDLSSNDFYGLLLKLPTLDLLEGEKFARIIYRIIEQSNFSRNFENSENKSRFLKEGMVLVRHQGKLQFFHAGDSYLPSTKIAIKKKVPILEKGQRTNNANFKRIFGCREYTQNYKIIEDSIKISVFNGEFQQYYSDFLKYAVAYGEKNKNIEENIFRLKITLVSSLKISEDNHEICIDEENIVLRDSVTQWFIVVGSIQYDTYTLSTEIENIFANIANSASFDVGKLGELFRTKEKVQREFLIDKEFGTLDVIGGENGESNLEANFLQTLKSISQDFDCTVSKIDFNDFAKLENLKKIIKLFSNLNIDISTFDEAGFAYTIDLTPLYKSELSDLIETEKTNYTNWIFTKALNDVALQGDFLKKKREFEEFEICEYKNSIYFNVFEEVNRIFGNWNDAPVEDAAKVYVENYNALNPGDIFKDEIVANSKVQTMIYFNKIREFNNWMTTQIKKAEKDSNERALDPYKEMRNIVPYEESLFFTEPVKTKKNTSSFGRAFSATNNEKDNQSKKLLGNKGELLVYNLLCKKFGEDKVTAVSEAFVDLGILKAGQGASGCYDISYVDENGIPMYVEVKAGRSNSFIITSNELNFAKKYPDRFELYLVYDVNVENPKYCKLPYKFWEDSSFKLYEVVERIEVSF